MNQFLKLIYKLMLFVFIWILLIPYLISKTGFIQNHFLVGYETYRAINKSEHKLTDNTVVVLGDSVAYQLYNQGAYNNAIYSLSCNQAISMAGQYLLLENILRNNKNKIRKVYLIYHPISFRNNLDQIYVFNYFIKPFYNQKYCKLLSADTKQKIAKVPGYFTSFLAITRISDYSPDLSRFEDPVKSAMEEKKFILSSVSLEYLIKMKAALQGVNIEFEVVSPDLKEDFMEYDCEEFKKTVIINGLQDSFLNYFSFNYIGKDHFSDILHYKEPKSLGHNPLSI